VAQVVECLLCKYKALSSKPGPIREEKKTEGKKGQGHDTSGRAPAW
jgi:hypothetical protein